MGQLQILAVKVRRNKHATTQQRRNSKDL